MPKVVEIVFEINCIASELLVKCFRFHGFEPSK